MAQAKKNAAKKLARWIMWFINQNSEELTAVLQQAPQQWLAYEDVMNHPSLVEKNFMVDTRNGARRPWCKTKRMTPSYMRHVATELNARIRHLGLAEKICISADFVMPGRKVPCEGPKGPTKRSPRYQNKKGDLIRAGHLVFMTRHCFTLNQRQLAEQDEQVTIAPSSMWDEEFGQNIMAELEQSYPEFKDEPDPRQAAEAWGASIGQRLSALAMKRHEKAQAAQATQRPQLALAALPTQTAQPAQAAQATQVAQRT